MPISESVLKELERSCGRAGLKVEQVLGVFQPRTDSEARKLADLIDLYAEAFKTAVRVGHPLDELLEGLSAVTDLGLSIDEVARAWEEYFRRVPGLVEAMVERGVAEVTPKGIVEFIKPKRVPPRKRTFEEMLREVESLVDTAKDLLESRTDELEYELAQVGKSLSDVNWEAFRRRVESELDAVLKSFRSRIISLSEARRRVRSVIGEINRRANEVLSGVRREVAARKVREVFRPTVLTCPRGEEALRLEVLWGWVQDHPELKEELRGYVWRNFRELYPEAPSRPSRVSPTLEKYVRMLVEAFKLKHSEIWDLLEKAVTKPETTRYIAWCSKSDQFFEIRAGYVRGRYVERLGRLLPAYRVAEMIRREVERVAPPAPPAPAYVYRPPRRPTAPYVRPFGITPAAIVYEPRRIFNVIGGTCPICGTPTSAFTANSGWVLGMPFVNARCPTCWSAFWYIPQLDRKGINPPSNYMEWWEPRWVSNLEKLRAEGWEIGPFSTPIVKYPPKK